MTEVVAPRPMTYSCLVVDGNSGKKAKGTNDYEFYGYKNCLLKTMKLYQNQNKNLKEKSAMYIMKKLLRLH